MELDIPCSGFKLMTFLMRSGSRFAATKAAVSALTTMITSLTVLAHRELIAQSINLLPRIDSPSFSRPYRRESPAAKSTEEITRAL